MKCLPLQMPVPERLCLGAPPHTHIGFRVPESMWPDHVRPYRTFEWFDHLLGEK